MFLFSILFLLVFFFKQKTAYEMRISDWSSDVCSSDLLADIRCRFLLLVGDALLGGADLLRQPLGELALALGPFLGDRIRRLAVSRLGLGRGQIGRASCRERVCQYV